MFPPSNSDYEGEWCVYIRVLLLSYACHCCRVAGPPNLYTSREALQVRALNTKLKP